MVEDASLKEERIKPTLDLDDCLRNQNNPGRVLKLENDEIMLKNQVNFDGFSKIIDSDDYFGLRPPNHALNICTPQSV